MAPTSESTNQILINFIISHAEGDRRPYIDITILGYHLRGLLDSGSAVTAVGTTGMNILLGLGLKLDKTRIGQCRVANGQPCTSIGVIPAPVCLMNRVKLIDILVIPELATKLILGTDFWLTMDLVPNLKKDVWHFDSEDSSVEICGITNHRQLAQEQQVALEALLTKKFEAMSDQLGYTCVAVHDIRLKPGTIPIKQRYYPVSPAKQKILDHELQQMLKLGVIEPSKSAWSSPVLLVPKSNGEYRFCVDYRALNKVTVKDAYPLPYVNAILDRLKEARYLSCLDIKSAYWQVPMKESARELTAFTVPGRGLYQFLRMPFGLTNAPATWQRLIDQVLGVDLEPHVMVYLDDIVIFTPTFEEHLKVLEKVLDRLATSGLTLSRDKCQFCKDSLRYLGYVVDQRGLRVDPEKVASIMNVSTPTTAKEVRSFLGMASWYRRFIPSFATIVAPLTGLTKKHVSFAWTEKCEEAFRNIKNCLVSPPILTCPDFDKPFILQTDASAYGLGAVLTQKFEDGEKVICFLSRSLTKAERNFTTTERECLAVLWAVEKLRHYLEGTEFTVVTDHSSLLWLDRLKDPTGRLARWALRLQQFTYTIVHRKGSEHVVPDYLSRSVPISIEQVDVCEGDFANTTDCWYRKMVLNVKSQPDRYSQWREENGLLYKYKKCTIPELSCSTDYWKIVVPRDKRKDLLVKYHNDVRSGHVGSNKTYWKLQTRYTWPKMRYDVGHYVKSCKTCAACKPEQKLPAGQMGSPRVTDRPWQLLSLDYMGPFPRSSHGNAYLLVVNDYFSKFTIMKPFRAATTNL